MSTLKEIFDFERTINFLQRSVNGTIVVICTIHNLEEFTIWKGDKWENVIGRLKDYTLHIDLCLCIREK